MLAFRSIVTLIKRGLARIGEALLIVQLSDALAGTKLNDAIFYQGHFAFFCMVGFGTSFLVDLFIEVTGGDLLEFDTTGEEASESLD